jgi:hypothetical protein
MSRAFELQHELTDTGALALVALDELMPVVREVRAASSLRDVFRHRLCRRCCRPTRRCRCPSRCAGRASSAPTRSS